MCGEDVHPKDQFKVGLFINCARLIAIRFKRIKQARDMFRQYRQVQKKKTKNPTRTEGDGAKERSRIETAKI